MAYLDVSEKLRRTLCLLTDPIKNKDFDVSSFLKEIGRISEIFLKFRNMVGPISEFDLKKIGKSYLYNFL